ncbi:MAG: LamG-like jellyroll fold domain-containing protein [Pirellula sp.]
MLNPEIRELIDLVLDGNPSERHTQRLDELLATDEKARQYYMEEIVLVHDLQRSAYSTSLPLPVSATSHLNGWTMGGAALVSVIAVAIFAILFRPTSEKNESGPIVSQVPIARILGGSTSHFEGMQPDGLVMNAGRYSLASGAVSMSFRSGAAVEIVGPAKFEIKNDLLMELDLGKARIHAPESAKGFRVEIPGMDVRDLGTEFGVSVQADKSAEIHVFIGSVELLRSGVAPRVLKEGSAIAWEGNGILPMSQIDDAKFATRNSIGYECWKSSSERWRNDEAALVYFDFEINPAASSEIVNLGRTGSPTNGVIQGPIHVSGRWPDKSALLFDKGNDHVRLDIPNQLESFTLSAWICMTRRTELLHSILMSIGDEPGEHHWQIGRDGSIRGGVQMVYSTTSHEDAVKVGVWQHVVAVVDRSKGLAMYYVNGKEVAQQSFASEIPLTFGPCTIGAWHAAKTNAWSRGFCGRIDEFAIFGRPLSVEEIQAMYQDGTGFDSGQ